MKTLTFKFLVKKVSENHFIASAPSLDGCFVEAETHEDAVDALQEAISEILREMIAANEEIVDDSDASIYSLSIDIAEKPSA
jgi:Uncharacterised protein family (UPF0150).